MSADIAGLRASLRRRLAGEPDLAELDLVLPARSSVRLVARRASAEGVGVGESRIGGLPDVPPGFDWPRWAPAKSRQNRFGEPWRPGSPTPLAFIAQIDLAALPCIDNSLPSAGWLYFFYDRYCEPWGFDPADRGCCRVLYADCDRSALAPAALPDDADLEHIAASCRVEASPELTLPEDLLSYEHYGTPLFDAYHRLCRELIHSGGSTHHRLLGHPQIIQNPMEQECQLASNGAYCGGGPTGLSEAELQALAAGAADWRLLLQVDTDEEGPGWMWGDCGRIYFWIKRQDLAARRFDDVWLVLQCS